MKSKQQNCGTARLAAALRREGQSKLVVQLAQKGQILRDPATLTVCAGAANDIGKHGLAEKFNKEAYAKSGGKPNSYQRASYGRTKQAQKRTR